MPRLPVLRCGVARCGARGPHRTCGRRSLRGACGSYERAAVEQAGKLRIQLSRRAEGLAVILGPA
ncbi:hypothetical protein GCM10010211_33750 [Streptomyces albospinus]|uniref:Uncharacterized protein n=1 Tax=Streptomyces albospinus TaxID=285515 RepID=A0ABQ2V3E7_9ACTN|nr:hypothetical protein [Streptomyces albospinus]GGU65773.1 hypothetical protein GCM10010211_33750 [Streptomyces albospinus]